MPCEGGEGGLPPTALPTYRREGLGSGVGPSGMGAVWGARRGWGKCGVGPPGKGGSAGCSPLRPDQLLKRGIVPERLELEIRV